MTASPEFRFIDETVVHTGHVITTAIATFEAPDGRHITRDVVHHPGAVAVVAVDGDEVVLVRQYRCGPQLTMLEIPAGLRDIDGEDPMVTAARELVEEAGLSPRELVLLCRYHAAPGFCDEQVHLYLATEFDDAPVERHGVEEQFMEVVRVPLAEARRMIDDGAITDVKTILGITMALDRLGPRGIGRQPEP